MNEDNEFKEPKRKKSKIVWILAIIGILIMSSVVVLYYRASKELVPVFKVKIDTSENGAEIRIETVEYSVEEVQLTQKPVESSSHIPGIYIIVYGSKNEQGYYQPYSDWTSKDFTGGGTYELEAPFKFEPEKGDWIKVQAKVVDNIGKKIAEKVFFIKWGFEPVLDAKCTVEAYNNTYKITSAEEKKDWIDPEIDIQKTSEDIPGIYFMIENDVEQLNLINSLEFTGEGEYNIRAYFEKTPVVGELITLELIIKDSRGVENEQFPGDDSWVRHWV